jgi:predicted nucleotidyltransferase
MSENRILVPKEQIADFCRRHHIRKLALFGSVLRDDFGIIDIEEELSGLFGGRRVDIVPEKYLNRRLRARVLATAEVQYAEG